MQAQTAATLSADSEVTVLPVMVGEPPMYSRIFDAESGTEGFSMLPPRAKKEPTAAVNKKRGPRLPGGLVGLVTSGGGRSMALATELHWLQYQDCNELSIMALTTNCPTRSL